MANYVLTQTGQEVQDILDSMGATYFFSQTATFASDNTYADYPYKGTISLVGVDGTMGVEVSFSNDQAISGNYSPICNTTNDAVEIWSKVNTSITIPTIKIYKNGYVNLNGSSNYMPQSGGNFTGAISVNNDAVLTTATGSTVRYRLVQGTLNTSVTVGANANGKIVEGKKLSQIWSSFAVNNITGIADDKVLGVDFLWTNSSVCAPVDCLVQSGSITVTVRNLTSSAITATGVRLGIHYEV